MHNVVLLNKDVYIQVTTKNICLHFKRRHLEQIVCLFILDGVYVISVTKIFLISFINIETLFQMLCGARNIHNNHGNTKTKANSAFQHLLKILKLL